jgi:hypothetical protein
VDARSRQSALMPLAGRRRRSCRRPSEGQQPVQSRAVRSGKVDDLPPARRSGHQGDRVRPDVKCRGDRSQGGGRGLAGE